ncbi:hypothetical protein TWF569_005718 [Orbilia oligospora]|nr:hypothetical protein TWF706_007087 [Orbilia oligospora]KAF3121807.1 hypothetical protein TWF594_003117 [Orbilia oligospora]KAF3148373.1 hypothetical protein TWF569_005718 [Orbilia oligospora]
MRNFSIGVFLAHSFSAWRFSAGISILPVLHFSPEHPGRYKEYKPIVHAGFENHKLADPRNVRVTAVQQRYLRSAATSIIGTWINALADMVHHAPGFP